LRSPAFDLGTAGFTQTEDSAIAFTLGLFNEHAIHLVDGGWPDGERNDVGQRQGSSHPQTPVRNGYGALSPNAVRALSRGAKMAGCYMSTGEGSLSPYHVEGGGDILYQIGPAKFGCRTPDRLFDDEKAAAILAWPQAKMVEIKLAQGAKPGKGGVLPKEKITKEIAEIRGIAMGVDCHSPNRFEEFDDAPSLLDFIERVRKLTGKPVGLKMVVGSTAEIDELCREIRKRGDGPDFIAVDGNEGGAAPLALADYVGLPVVDALIAVDNALRRDGLRSDITVMAVPDRRDDAESVAPVGSGSH
jgi:glutamate synthase domain-containing protein 2